MADTVNPGPTQRKPRRARRWFFRLLILSLVAVGGYFLLMQSFLTRWIVMGQIGKQVGGQASASSVIVSPSGRVVIKDGLLRAPGVQGDAGTVFSVRRLEAEFAWSSLLGGGLAVHRIELDKPLARISQSVDDGTVNIAALSPPKSTPPKEVPKVIVRGGVIELGEHVTDPSKHTGSGPVPLYAALKSIDVGGEVIESPDETGAKLFSFHEVEGARPVPGGLAVKGRISREGIALTLEGLSLSTWSAASTPAATRTLFEELAMQGEIPRAVITYSYAGGWEARISLLNVAINLPVTARPDEDDDGNPLPQSEEDKKRRLRMERVNGEVIFTNKGVRGELNGFMEELPYEVTFHVDGTTMDAPFVCTLESRDFALTKKPQIMKFAPGVARRRLEQFNNPTGKLDAKVTVTRGAPAAGKEADIDVAGEIHIRDMTSAFERFPYRFSKMTGEVTFDGSRVEIVSIDAQAQSGARLHATGIIAPPNDAAGVDLDIHVTAIPVDDQLRDAMLGRRRVLDALFSKERYQELLDSGLIATPRQHNDALAALARLPREQADSDQASHLREIASRRVFEMGGTAEVRVQIHRDIGPDKEWDDIETISIADAGLVPQNVGYPLLANQIVIVKKDTIATVEGGVYRGLSGGAATVSAKADFSKLDDPRLPFVPDVTIDATDVPVDALLFHSLPDTQQLGGSLHQLLSDLNAAGLMDCSVKLGMNGAEPFLHVDANLKDAIAHPHAEGRPDRLLLSQIRGNVTITQEDVALSLSARATSTDGSAEPAPASVRLSVPISMQFSDLAPPKPPSGKGLSLVATADQLDTSLPVEDLVAIFAPATARNLEDLRARYEPYGIADLAVKIDQPTPNAETTSTITASNARGYELNALNGRLGLQSSTGSVTITTTTADAPAVITTDGLTGTLIFQGDAVGTLSAKGAVTSEGKNVPGTQGLTLSVSDARFESPLTKSAVRALGPRSLAEFLDTAVVEGLYNLDLTLGPPPAGDRSLPVTGVLRPRSLQMSIEKTPVIFGDVKGEVEFAGGDGRLRGVHVAAGDWSASADGAWISIPSGSTAFQCTLGLDCNGLPNDLLAVLPSELKSVFDELSFTCTGPAELSEAQLSMTFGQDGTIAAFKNTGRVTIQGGKMDVGATVDRIDGTLDYSVSRTGPEVPPEFEIWTLLDRFALSGVGMTNGRVRAASGGAGEILVPLISADCHGGRVAGTANVSAPQNGKRRYEVELQASDVRFASILSDFQSVAPHDPAQVPLSDLPDDSRGRLDMGVSLAGAANDPGSRRGRGTATVGGGRIVNIPLLVPLVRLTNLQVPRDEKLDYAYADFYLQGRQMIFNEVSISSRSVAVYGYGMATLPDLNLDLRFESKSRARIPVLTGVFEFLRNELVTVVVTGTLSDPHMGVAPFSSATKALGRMFHGTPTPEQKTLDQIERRSDQDPRRMMRGRGVVEPR